jgi:diamine N-acetyltransferase
MKQVQQVSLRAMEPEDLDLLYHIENDETMWGMSLTNVPYSRFVLHEFMSETTGDIYTDKQVRLIVENDQHQPIGLADIMKFDPKNQKAEIGIIISKTYRRQGYAKAAVERLHQYVQSTLHLHQLYAIIAVENEASLNLFTHMGYQQGGMLRDWLFDGKTYHDALILQRVL